MDDFFHNKIQYGTFELDGNKKADSFEPALVLC